MTVFDTLTHITYLVAATGFVLGLHMMTSPSTARRGNRLSAAGMVLAVLTTVVVLIHDDSVPAAAWITLLIGLAAGGLAGLVAAAGSR